MDNQNGNKDNNNYDADGTSSICHVSVSGSGQ